MQLVCKTAALCLKAIMSCMLIDLYLNCCHLKMKCVLVGTIINNPAWQNNSGCVGVLHVSLTEITLYHRPNGQLQLHGRGSGKRNDPRKDAFSPRCIWPACDHNTRQWLTSQQLRKHRTTQRSTLKNPGLFSYRPTPCFLFWVSFISVINKQHLLSWISLIHNYGLPDEV